MKLLTIIKERWQTLVGWQKVLLIWLLTVIYIFTAGWFGITVVPAWIGWSEGIPSNIEDLEPDLSTMFLRWDAGYYLEIARGGYESNGTEQAFFPLYPLLVQVLTDLNGLPRRWNGIFLSLASFALAIMLLYVWVKHNYDEELALLAATLLCLSPVSFYFVAFYAEPLFLVTSLAAIYFARRGWFLSSGMAIALAGATRPTAFLLGVLYVMEFLIQKQFTWTQIIKFIAGALFAPLGAAAYFAFLGYPDGVMAGMDVYNSLLDAEWDTVVTWPWELLYNAFRAIFYQSNITPDWFSVAFTLHDTLFAVGALIIALWSARYMRLSSAALLLVSILYVFTLHGPGGYAFDSAPRRVAVIVPIYVAAAIFLHKKFPKYQWVFVSISALWLGVLTAWFTSGRWVS